MASELLKRSEVKEADTWNVKDMYPDPLKHGKMN